MSSKNEAKVKFTAETGEFNSEISQSNDKLSELKAELKLNAAQMKTTGQTTDGLQQKHKILEDQLQASHDKTEALTRKAEKASQIFGENSREASKLRTQLLNAQSAEERIKQAISECNNELSEQPQGFADAGDAAKNSSSGFTVMKGALADLVSNGIQWCLGKLGEFKDYLISLPEETRDFRAEMATIDTSFTQNAHSVEQGKETWKSLYAVMGDESAAVEASNNISKFAKSQKELNEWTRIATGIYGTYQDSIPIEALAEAANETIKTGQVTGAMADSLNWSSEAAKMFAKYMNEDVTTAEDAFNVALSECSNEQERNKLITETMTTLYGGAADKYRETAGAQLEAKEATAEHMLAENQLATAIEPVTTKWQTYKTELAVGVTPVIEKVSGVAINALDWMREHPKAMQLIASVAGVLGVSLGSLAVVVGVLTIKQWAMNSAILANPITWIVVGIVAAIATLTASGVALYQNWDTIKAKCSQMCTSVKTGWNNLKASTVQTWNNVKNAIMKPINEARDKVHTAVENIKGFFNNMKVKLPKIKLPHIKMKGELSLNPPSVPKLSIEWYSHGGIMTKPTIFGFNGGSLMAGGESGPEAILPLNRLDSFISSAFERYMPNVDLSSILELLEDIKNKETSLNVNGQKFAETTAADTDRAQGSRSAMTQRGLILPD